MAQITITNDQHQVVDFYIIEEDLFNKLLSVQQANQIQFFTYESLLELKQSFLSALLDKFQIRNKNKNQIWHTNKANFYALSLYPWYEQFVALIDAIEKLNYSLCELQVHLTSN